MASQIGYTSNEIIPLGGFTATQDTDGGWTASRKYSMLSSAFQTNTVLSRFRRGQSATTADPTIPGIFSFLVVESRSVSYMESGTCELTVNYTGSSTGQYDDEDLAEQIIPSYRLEGRLVELPLSEHPKWKALSDQEKFALDELFEERVKPNYDGTQVGQYEVSDTFSWAIGFKPLKWSDNEPITLADDAQEFAKRISAGQKTFLSTSITWTETTQGNNGMTTGQLNKLGRIANPRGNPPDPSGDRDWLLTSASQEQRGELYQTTIEWTLSEREGWDEFLYDSE